MKTKLANRAFYHRLSLVSILLVTTNLCCVAQSGCIKPDTVYVFFEQETGEAPDYLNHQEVSTSGKVKDFKFGYHFPEVFRVTAKKEQINASSMKSLTFTSIKELLEIEKNFIACYLRNVEEGKALKIHTHDDIFDCIYIVEKIGSNYYKYRVLWLQISYN